MWELCNVVLTLRCVPRTVASDQELTADCKESVVEYERCYHSDKDIVVPIEEISAAAVMVDFVSSVQAVTNDENDQKPVWKDKNSLVRETQAETEKNETNT